MSGNASWRSETTKSAAASITAVGINGAREEEADYGRSDVSFCVKYEEGTIRVGVTHQRAILNAGER